MWNHKKVSILLTLSLLYLQFASSFPPALAKSQLPTYKRSVSTNKGPTEHFNSHENNNKIKRPSKGYSLLIAQFTFSSISTLAYTGLLPNNQNNLPYTISAIQRDQAACVFTFIGASTFVKCVTYAAKANILPPKVTRKIIHTFSAPFFLACWPLFSNHFAARFFAGAIMIVFNSRMYMAGRSNSTDTESQIDESGCSSSTSIMVEESDLANAISRSGDAKEVIGGPFLYGLIVLIATLLFWRDNLIGIIAICVMAAGDGASDLIGRKYGTNNKWPFRFCSDKSIVGTFAFFVSSFVVSVGLSSLMIHTKSIVYDYSIGNIQICSRIAVICLFSAFVELLPFANDNLSVPLFAAVLSKALIH